MLLTLASRAQTPAFVRRTTDLSVNSNKLANRARHPSDVIGSITEKILRGRGLLVMGAQAHIYPLASPLL